MKSIDEVVSAMKTQEWGITEAQGRFLFDFILREKPRSILELGCGIGTSACYMAAALEHLGSGRILSIDRNPDLPECVARSFEKVDPALQRFHEIVIVPQSYNVQMMALIEENTIDGACNPCFDFCFIDGAHTWETDACAFFLSEKLLKPGGWILLDDLQWTIAGSPEALAHGMGNGMPTELQNTPQVMKVFELCVTQHPGFDSFTITDDWGWARKRDSMTEPRENSITRLFNDHETISAKIRRRLRKVLGRKNS